MLRFYDFDGTERDAAWANDLFGPLDVFVPDPERELWRLVELRAAAAPKGSWAVTITARDGDGNPAPGIKVALAPKDIAGELRMENTDAAGQVTFGVDGRYQFSPVDDHGHWLITAHPDSGGGDCWNSFGVVMGQNRWLNPVFRWGLGEQEPEPPEPPEDGDVVERLARIEGKLDELLLLALAKRELVLAE